MNCEIVNDRNVGWVKHLARPNTPRSSLSDIKAHFALVVSQFEIRSIFTDNFYREVIAKRDTPPSTSRIVSPALALPTRVRDFGRSLGQLFCPEFEGIPWPLLPNASLRLDGGGGIRGGRTVKVEFGVAVSK